jgi:hypothetical protein
MKVCIVSDSHDHRDHLKAAVSEAKNLGAEAVIHAGDLVAPSTLHSILPLGLPIYLVHGNNQGDLYHLSKLANKPENRVHYFGQDGSFTLAGKRIFLVHYPHYAKAFALTGEYDLTVNGHEHRAVVEVVRNIKGTDTVRVDPGTVGGVSATPTYVLGDLAAMQFEIRPVAAETVPSSGHTEKNAPSVISLKK